MANLTPALPLDLMISQYQKSSSRLFIFDYDGTLTSMAKDPKEAVLSTTLVNALKALVADKSNNVWVITGRDQTSIAQQLEHLPGLGVSAEHGGFVRYPTTQEWQKTIQEKDMDWQDQVLPIFQRYINLTPGSGIERKRLSLLWHYRNCMDGLGISHAPKCREELNDIFSDNNDVEVIENKANVEVKLKLANKGALVKNFVKNSPNSLLMETKQAGAVETPSFDFVCCLGDDETDESMFEVLRNTSLPKEAVFTCFVGPSSKETAAKWQLPDPNGVAAALEALANAP